MHAANFHREIHHCGFLDLQHDTLVTDACNRPARLQRDIHRAQRTGGIATRAVRRNVLPLLVAAATMELSRQHDGARSIRYRSGNASRVRLTK